ncbi:hypothetical protein COHA_010454 [Chlorella ohadii]|uniref:Uncharacterized protein n=1 Tax=Chlorella ohadii TaxID=2649997 RepID=A0AAD5DDR6_9CHLO|nr:hypothetical protein COHA_010454 [Chlorella ohadii]
MAKRVMFLLAAALLIAGAWAAKPIKQTCQGGQTEVGGCYQCQNKNTCKICWSPVGERGYGVNNSNKGGNKGGCVPCPQNCEKCQGNAQVCTRCLPGFGKGNGVKNPCVLCDPDTQIVDPNSKKCVCNKAAGYVKQGKACVLAAAP